MSSAVPPSKVTYAAGPLPSKTLFWRLAALVVPALMRLLFRLRVEGAAHIPVRGPAIVAANHASYIDPPVIGVGVLPRTLAFMAKASLFRIPILRRIVRALYAFPVAKGQGDREAIKTALRVLAEGHLLAIFPQGTRVGGETLELTRGVALLAQHSGAPVVPAAIIGSDRVWRGGALPLRFPRLIIRFGAAIHLEEIDGPPREAQRVFTERLAAEIQKLRGLG